jgi:hypothetical protein
MSVLGYLIKLGIRAGTFVGRREPVICFQIAPKMSLSEPAGVVRLKFIEEQPQMVRLTTPKLKEVWGPACSK